MFSESVITEAKALVEQGNPDYLVFTESGMGYAAIAIVSSLTNGTYFWGRPPFTPDPNFQD